MLGIFDSGSGGLTFLAAMRARHPGWSYCYLGDYDHCPYGDRTPEEIRGLTEQGVRRLFDRGCTLVILACNTASAWSLRHLQMTLPREQRVLGVTIPGAERVVELGLTSVTVFATQQTVQSRTYRERMNLLDDRIDIEEIALPSDLVRDIESLLPVHRCHTGEDFDRLNALYDPRGWRCDTPEWRSIARDYFGHFTPRSAIVLGCTHYPYLRSSLEVLFPSSQIIDPSEESARKIMTYVQDHLIHIDQSGQIIFL